jgi:hypothetical protein
MPESRGESAITTVAVIEPWEQAEKLCDRGRLTSTASLIFARQGLSCGHGAISLHKGGGAIEFRGFASALGKSLCN